MMAHTHRHYRSFFRLLSSRAHLYTEMLPASQVCASYELAVERLQLGLDPYHPEKMLENVVKIRQSYIYDPVLQELLAAAPSTCLQLGGRSHQVLGRASAIALAFGYSHVNLNCGCPSPSVSGRRTGAALMLEPSTVCHALETMSLHMDRINPDAVLSVKHRLGVIDTNTEPYNPLQDRKQDDSQAYQTAGSFVGKIISANSKLSKIQVHARIALLGDNWGNNKSKELWVPGVKSITSEKVNHSRLQYKARQRARQTTLQNRSVPPLRPNVVQRLADEFPLDVVTNGGIKSMEALQKRSEGNVVGAMIGRAAINHPCAFSQVDRILWNATTPTHTRRQLMEHYIDYCQEEEACYPYTDEKSLKQFRKTLVGVPFHLFVGTVDNDHFQRRLRKLVARADRYTAKGMLLAALAETSTANHPLDSCRCEIPIDPKGTKRSGVMQKVIF